MYPHIYCQQMNIGGQPEIFTTGTYWKEKGGLGEDSAYQWDGEHGGMSLEIRS